MLNWKKLDELLTNPEIAEILNKLGWETVMEYCNDMYIGILEGGLACGLIVITCIGTGNVIKKHIRKTEKKRSNKVLFFFAKFTENIMEH